MKERIISKGLTVAIFLLFLGVSVQPSIAITSESLDNEDDCEICPKVSKSHLLLIKSFLNRLEEYDDELSVLCKLDPGLEEKYKAIKDMNDKGIWDFPIICTVLEFALYFCEVTTTLLSNFGWRILEVLPFDIIRITFHIVCIPFFLIFFMVIFPYYALCFEIY